MFELIDTMPADAFMAFVLGVTWLLTGAIDVFQE